MVPVCSRLLPFHCHARAPTGRHRRRPLLGRHARPPSRASRATVPSPALGPRVTPEGDSRGGWRNVCDHGGLAGVAHSRWVWGRKPMREAPSMTYHKLHAADLEARRLHEAGFRFAFGMPGGEGPPLGHALEASGTRFVVSA